MGISAGMKIAQLRISKDFEWLGTKVEVSSNSEVFSNQVIESQKKIGFVL